MTALKDRLEAVPYDVRPIPGEEYAFQVSSKSRQGVMHRVDWFIRDDATLGADCDCEAFTFKRACGHIEAVQTIVRASDQFKEAVRSMGNLAPVPRTNEDNGSIEEALAAIYAKVGYVQKSGKITEGPARYSYAGENDIIEHLRPAMVEHAVTVRVASVRDVVHEAVEIGSQGRRMQRTTLIATVRFTHGPSRTFVDCEAIGEGMDSGDKSSPKAQTSALKYALRQTFCLETGDDPDDSRPEQENGHQTHQNARPAPEQRGQALDADAIWKALTTGMRDKSLSSRDIAPVLGGVFSRDAVTTWLEADPSRTIGTLISAAIPGGGK